MMKALLWGLWLIAVSLCPAQQPAPDGSPSTLTLPQALSLADQFNPQLRAANAQRRGAEAGITTAAAYPNPEVNLLAGPQFSLPYINGPGPAGMLQHYSFDQPIDLPRIRRTRVEEATLRRDTTAFAYSEVQLGVRGAVKQAFFDILRRQGEVELAQENLRLIEDLRRRIQVQVDVGEAARLELTRSESEVAIARTFARSAELRLYRAIATLRALIGTPLPLNVKFAGELAGPKTLPPIDDLRRDVLDRHPALAQARAEVRRSEARLRYEKALRLPAPSLRGEYEHQPDLGFYRLGVSIPVPL